MDAERAREQLLRILGSAAFADAGRASSFLRFVVERALQGRAAEIKESVIAVEVLGRNASSFDSKLDPIIRVEAGRLRDRLSSYYQDEGGADGVLITLPKGSYVPEFSVRQAGHLRRESMCYGSPSCRLRTPRSNHLLFLPMAANSRSLRLPKGE